MAVLFLGIGLSAVGCSALSVALARFGVATTANARCRIPVVAITTGWLLLDETPHAVALTGGGIALLGVVGSRGRPQPASTATVAGASRAV